MSTRVSTLGLLMNNINTMSSAQSLMSTLSQQMASEKKSTNLSDYSSSDAQTLMTYNNQKTQQNSYLNVMTTLSSRIQTYNSCLTGIESTASTATSALASAQTYNPDTNSSLSQEIQSMLSQVQGYLNEQVGDRYIFAGTRYNTVPVTDLTALAVPPTETAPYTVSSPNLPSYDAEYPATDSAAYTRDTVSISSTVDLTYGATSTETGFQELIMGLRWAYAATQDPTNYNSYMSTARDLISQGLIDTRTTHTRISNANATLETTQSTISDSIDTLKGNIDDIQSVDVNEISLKVTTYQSTLQASYAAIAIMSKLSIVNYL